MLSVSLRALRLMPATAALFYMLVPASAFAQTTFHLYVYNECKSDIDVVASYFPIGKDQRNESSTTVRSGSQQMVGVSDRNAFVLSAKTNGKRWDTLEFGVDVPEYTHVLSCDCQGTDCPDLWPGPLRTRQHAQ